MPKRTKIEAPHFPVGTAVQLSGDILRYAINGVELEKPDVFIPSGEIGQVQKPLSFGNYLVRFPQATLNVYALRLTACDPQPEVPLYDMTVV